jgi:hypothetical protein
MLIAVAGVVGYALMELIIATLGLARIIEEDLNNVVATMDATISAIIQMSAGGPELIFGFIVVPIFGLIAGTLWAAMLENAMPENTMPENTMY